MHETILKICQLTQVKKKKVARAQPMAHRTAEPLEILITRPPQKLKSVYPTHQKTLEHKYHKYI